MSSKQFTQGGTLIEVLVAVLVLSVGLLGALKLQTEGVRQNADSRYTILASTLAHDALNAVAFDRSNEMAAWCGVTEGAAPASLTGRPKEWLERLQDELPDGKAAVSCDSVSKSTSVIITWTPPGREKVTAEYDMYS